MFASDAMVLLYGGMSGGGGAEPPNDDRWLIKVKNGEFSVLITVRVRVPMRHFRCERASERAIDFLSACRSCCSCCLYLSSVCMCVGHIKDPFLFYTIKRYNQKATACVFVFFLYRRRGDFVLYTDWTVFYYYYYFNGKRRVFLVCLRNGNSGK